MDERLGVLLLMMLVGIFIMVMAIPLIRRSVKPNWFYGFRVPDTVNNPELWYPANEYAGRWLLLTGAATCVVGLVLYLIPSIDAEGIAIGIVFTMVPLVLITAAMCFRHLGKLKRERGPRAR